jgi:hypothetical protein
VIREVVVLERRVKTRSLAVALAVAAIPATAASARVRDGQLQWTHAENCFSAIFPPAVYAAQTGGDAGVVEPDDGSALSGDHTFYVRAIFGGINSDCVGVGGIVSLEFIPPIGVSVVNDPAYPPYWTSISPDGSQEIRQTTPVVVSSGGPDPGGVTAQLSAGSGGPVWRYTDGGSDIAVYVPLRTSRALDGILGPACPQIQANSQLVGSANDISSDDYLTLQDTAAPAPCPPDLAGDNLQVVMNVADTGYPTRIVPYVGLFATQPSSSSAVGSGPQDGGATTTPAPQGRVPAHKLSVQAPAAVSVSRARHGTKVTVRNVPDSKLATITLTLRGQLLARAIRRAGANGVVTVTLTPNRTSAARLHAGGRLRLTVTAARARVIDTIRLRAAGG